MSRSDQYQQLNDDKVEKLIETNKEIYDTLLRLLGVRYKTLELLQQLKDDIEKSCNNSKNLKRIGTASAITGAGTSIVGIILSPFTFGTSLSLTVLGGTLAATGVTTIMIGDESISKQKIDAANEACRVDKVMMQKLNELGERYQSELQSLAERHSITTTKVLEITNVEKAVDSGALVGSVADTAKVAKTAVAKVQAGTRTLWLDLSTSLRVVSVGAVVLDPVFIPVDIAVLTKVAYDDVHQSKGACAQDMQEMIERLKEHRDRLIEEKKKYFQEL